MVPALSHPTWAKLIKGELQHKFSKAAAGMLFFNLQTQLARDPSKLAEHIAEARRFFEKYEAILGDDVRVLFR